MPSSSSEQSKGEGAITPSPTSPEILTTPDADSEEDLPFGTVESGYELDVLDGQGKQAEQEGLLQEGSDRGTVVYDAFGEPEDSGDENKPKRRAGAATMLYTREEEGTVVRRLDIWLVGGLAVLYMLSFLDRSNIGNARIAGMEEDLDLGGGKYERLLVAFYVTYILFEWMTLCWKMFRAHIYVATCVGGWGILACMQSLAINWQSMVCLRALIGITEAAFGPGVPFYLSLFYRREELALRTGFFIAAAPIATAYAGLLAYVVTTFSSGIAPWRLLFILEGFPSIIAAIVAFYWIPDSPTDCRFLNKDQKQIAYRRLLVVHDRERRTTAGADDTDGLEPSHRVINWDEVRHALGDAGNWLTAMLLFSVNTSFASIPVFLPTIIHEMDPDVSPATAQALSIPPYLLAFFVIIISTYLSDRVQSRSAFIITLTLASTVGYILLALAGHLQLSLYNAISTLESLETGTKSPEPTAWLSRLNIDATDISYRALIGMKYTGVMITAGTIFSLVALIIVWNGNNNEHDSSRGTGMAVLQALGQCGSLLGTLFYPESDAPGYVKGSVLCGAFMMLAMVLAVVQRCRLARMNRLRERAERRRVAQGEQSWGEGGVEEWRFIL